VLVLEGLLCRVRRCLEGGFYLLLFSTVCGVLGVSRFWLRFFQMPAVHLVIGFFFPVENLPTPCHLGQGPDRKVFNSLLSQFPLPFFTRLFRRPATVPQRDRFSFLPAPPPFWKVPHSRQNAGSLLRRAPNFFRFQHRCPESTPY